MVSPLKKVKRKADYGKKMSEDEEDDASEPPQKAMRRLSLQQGHTSASGSGRLMQSGSGHDDDM